MKTTIVPAQITTVEDKIAGNFNLAQIVLLLVAFLLGCTLYIAVPPTFSFAFYKIPLIAVVSFLCSLLALRVKDKILLQWIVIFLRYNSRPRYFIANKNDLSYRVVQTAGVAERKAAVHKKSSQTVQDKRSFSLEKERLITNANAKVRITFARKGGIDVSVS